MTYRTALSDISGKCRLESEDPRWLLTDLALLEVRGDEAWWEHICADFVTHNTGNLLVFLDKTKHQLRQVLVQRGKHLPSSQSHVEQCCISLHVTTLLLHVFVRTLSDHQVMTNEEMGHVHPLCIVVAVLSFAYARASSLKLCQKCCVAC